MSILGVWKRQHVLNTNINDNAIQCTTVIVPLGSGAPGWHLPSSLEPGDLAAQASQAPDDDSKALQ